MGGSVGVMVIVVVMIMQILDGHNLSYVEVKESIKQRIRDNQGIITDESASEMNINHENRWCKNGLRPNRRYNILIVSGKLWTG
jgi:hypothetical protein